MLFFHKNETWAFIGIGKSLLINTNTCKDKLDIKE